MKTVKPIKDIEKIKEILKYLKKTNKRNYLLMFLGFNTGLRVSDLLNLETYQVRDTEFISIREKKTNKERAIPILPHVRNEINKYITLTPNQRYLFKGSYRDKPITRFRAWQIIKRIQRKFKLEDLGTHTFRKTFGYHFYKDTKKIATLMCIFNHDTEKMTLKYIGVDQDRINEDIAKWGGIKD